jgi:hypothetical protein
VKNARFGAKFLHFDTNSTPAYTDSVVGQLFARMADSRFGKELQDNLPLLFTGRSGRLAGNHPSEYAEPRAFDHAVATVVTPDLQLRFVRVRGEFSIHIAAPGEHPKWEPLDTALLWSQNFDWSSVASFLNDNWDHMKAAARF